MNKTGRNEQVGITQREKVIGALVVTVAVCAFAAGVLSKAGGNLAFVEIMFTAAVVVSVVAGYLVGSWQLEGELEERAELGTAIERHRTTTGPPAVSQLGPIVRYPIVTRRGDPEDDDRPVPGPTLRARPRER